MQLNGIRICLITLVFSVVLISACRRKADVTTKNNAFIKTNGDNVIIGNIAIKTNSPLNTDEFKKYMSRVNELFKIRESGSPDHLEKFVNGVRVLIKDYPDRPNGYQDIMMAIEDYRFLGKPDQARALAKEMINSSAPDNFKLWAKGFLYRMDSMGKPITMNFIALDGREVDLEKMRGKVALIVFWETGFEGELSWVNASFEKFHPQGFEVTGIYCYSYTKENELKEYIKQHHISWPQYFDDKQSDVDVGNKFCVDFGIDGIPHMFLVDKKGCLRFDDVRARTKDNQVDLEKKIEELLAEQ